MTPANNLYELAIDDDVIGFESVYDAQEQLLDALDRCVGGQSAYQLQALLEGVRADIESMEEPEES